MTHWTRAWYAQILWTDTPLACGRGLKEQDFEAIAELLHKVLQVCKDVQAKNGKLLKDFIKYASSDPYCFPFSPIPSSPQLQMNAAVSCVLKQSAHALSHDESNHHVGTLSIWTENIDVGHAEVVGLQAYLGNHAPAHLISLGCAC